MDFTAAVYDHNNVTGCELFWSIGKSPLSHFNGFVLRVFNI